MSWELSKEGRIALQRRREQHQADQADEAKVLEQQRAANESARRRYRGGLQAAKDEQQKLRDAEFDDRVKPSAMRGWLVDHPGKSSKDFESVWPMLRVELLEKERTDQFNADLEAVRSMTTGSMLSF